MPTFLRTLTDREPLPAPGPDRRALVLSAKDGNEDAWLDLLSASRPAIGSLIRGFVGSIPGGVEEAESVSILAFTEALAAYDPRRDEQGVGVGAFLSLAVRRALSAAASSGRHPVTIPPRTAERYFGLLSMARGDRGAARALAPKHGVSKETWDLVDSAVFGLVSPEHLDTIGASIPDGTSEVEARADAQRAMEALATPADRAIVRGKFGFDGFRELTEAQIAETMGMSERTVRRRLAASLQTMRSALGVAK